MISIYQGIAKADYSLRNISVLNLLMPYSKEVQMEHPIRAFNGCYKWSSKVPKTLEVTSLPGEEGMKCQNSAMVQVGPRNDFDGIVWLTAQDVETDELLKCEARVRKIHRLEILTKFKTLDVGDFEQVELIGYDSEGNSFTTLEGLKFEWSVSGIGRADFVDFKNSRFRTTERRHSLEKMNYQSDIVILKGVRTGRVTLSVELLDRSYEERITTQVDIFVIEHFEVLPENDLFLLPCSQFPLSLYIVRTDNYRMNRRKVSLPNSGFVLSTKEQEICRIDDRGVLTSGKQTGLTQYIVADKAKSDNRIERQVRVVLPRTINLYVRELGDDLSKKDNQETLESYENNWNLLKGRTYKLLASLSDRNDNRISLGSNEKIEFEYNSNNFEEIERGQDYIIVRPTKIVRKSERIQADLILPNKNCIPHSYQTKKQYSILSEIRLISVSSSQVLLPSGGQRMMLFAIGGSGKFEWRSSRESVVQVEQNGSLISGVGGTAVISVRDRNNIKNQAQISVSVSDAAALRLIESKIELIIGGKREIMLSALDSQSSRFTYCTDLEFTFDSRSVSGLDIDSLSLKSTSLKQGIMVAKQIKAYLKEGKEAHLESFTKEYESVFRKTEYQDYIESQDVSEKKLSEIFAYYQTYGVCSGFTLTAARLGEYDLKHALIKKKGIVRVYEAYHLQADPAYQVQIHGDRPVILPNSNAVFQFAGGPWLWTDSNTQPDRLSYKVKYTKKGDQQALRVVSIRESEGLMRLEIECLYNDDGTFANRDIDLQFLGFNEKDDELLAPVQVKGELKVSCKLPKSIRMFNYREGEPVTSYIAHQKKKLGLRLGGEFDFVAELFDELDHLFWASQSGIYEWKMDNLNMGQWLDEDRKLNRNRLTLDSFKAGSGYARVVLNQLKSAKSEKENSKKFKLKKHFEDKLLIEALDQVSLDTDEIILFYHPEIHYELKIENGSGNFDVRSESGSFDAKYDPKRKKIIIKPQKIGSGSLEVQDLGAEARMKATARVHVVEIRKIVAKAVSRILEEGERTKITVHVYDEENRLIPVNQYNKMQLKLGVLDNMGKYVESKEIMTENAHEWFLVRTNKQGNYTFEVSGKDSEGFVKRSNQVEVSVFSKMTISPSNLLLGVGCVSAFEVRGGPDQGLRREHDFHLEVEGGEKSGQLIQRGDSKFEYRALNLGKDKVTVRLRSMKTRVVVGSVEIPIKVSKPDNFELVGISNGKMLNSSLARLMAIPMSGGEYFSPSLCPIAFEWANLNKNVVEIERSGSDETCGQLKADGHNQPTDLTNDRLNKLISSGWQGLAKNIRALNPGFADIEVRGRMGDWIYKTNKNIEVIDGLRTKRDKYIKVAGCSEGVLLLPPNTKHQIRLEGVSLSSNSDYLFSVLQSQSQKLIKTNVNGFLKTNNEEGYVLLRISEKKNPKNELLLPIVITRPAALIVEDSAKIGLVPVKSNMSLQVRLIDNLGRVFAHPLKDFPISANSSDSSILEAHYNSNRGQLEISAKRKGQAAVFVSAHRDERKLLDMIAVKIGSLISPASPVRVHVGGTVDFKINNQVLLDKSAWISSNPKVLAIEDGTVRALSSGKAELRFDESVNLSSIVSVYELDQIVEESSETQLTNVKSRSEYKESYHYMYKLYSQSREINLLQIMKSQPEVQNNLDWGCRISSESLTATRQRFINPQNSLPYMGCLIKFSDWAVSENWDFNPQVELVFYLENKQTGFKLEKRTRLSVLHGFFLSDKKLLNDGLLFDNDSRVKSVLIKTQKELNLSLEPQILKSFAKTDFDPKFGVFKIDLTFPENFSESKLKGVAKIESQETGQIISIPLVYDPASTILKRISKIASFSGSLSWFSFLDMLLLMIAASALVIIWYYIKGQERKGQKARRYVSHNRYVNEKSDFKLFYTLKSDFYRIYFLNYNFNQIFLILIIEILFFNF